MNDGVLVVSVPNDATCRCGEQMRAGEGAGFDPAHDEVICLHCMADRRAGRPQVLQRRQPKPTTPAVPSSDVWANVPPSPRRGMPTAVLVLLSAALVIALVGGIAVFRAAVDGARNKPADDATAYAFLEKTSKGLPVTWDPCVTIDLLVNTAAAPEGAETLLEEAIDRVNAASGLHLKVIGPTTEVPKYAPTDRDLVSGRPGSSRAPVLVAWTTPDVVPGLRGPAVGWGGPLHMRSNPLDRDRYVGGTIELDGPQLAGMLRQPGGHAAVRSVVLHQLAVLVGLTDVDTPTQVMTTRGSRATEFGKGDLAGLALVGSGGCPYDLTPDSAS